MSSLLYPGGEYPHKAEFYRAAVTVLRQRWGELSVIVISDDMEWCRRELRSGDQSNKHFEHILVCCGFF